MRYTMNLTTWGNIFAVPACVTDTYFKTASGLSVKVLLLILRHSDRILSVDELQASLSASEEDVRDAIAFWIANGVLAKAPDADKPSKPNTARPPDENEITAAEIAARVVEDMSVKMLLSGAESLYGRPLTNMETKTLVYMYEYTGLDADILLMLIDYCLRTGKKSIKYMLKTAESWADMEIDTHEKADLHLKRLMEKQSQTQLVKSCFGIYDRNLSKREESYIDKWFSEYGFGIEMIKLAFEKTVDNTGKLSFAYTDKILSNWKKEGCETPKDITEGKKSNKRIISEDTESYDIDAFENFGYMVPNGRE